MNRRTLLVSAVSLIAACTPPSVTLPVEQPPNTNMNMPPAMMMPIDRTPVRDFLHQFDAFMTPDDSRVQVSSMTEPEMFSGSHDGYACTYTTYDVTQNFDRVLGIGAAYASAKPGILLQGRGVLNGVFQTIPLKRTPITISVDLPISNPTRTIQNPSVDTIQAAISQLQRDIDAELPVLRSNFTHQTEVVNSFEEASLFFGVNLKYSAPLVSAGLHTSFSSTRSSGTSSFALKHIEELYTITFSDDLIASELDFLDPSVTIADLERLEDDGLIGTTNPPTYVKSITYGRLILATAKATEQFDTQKFGLVVEANAFGFSGDAGLTTDYQNLASQTHFEVLAIGASTEDAQRALAAAKIEDMFGVARATTAAPLYYAINYVKSPRPTARVGTTTQYTTQQCVPTGSKQPCARRCPAGWSEGSECSKAGNGIGLWSVWHDNGGMHAAPQTGNSQVNDPEMLATSARACFTASYTSGGISNDGELAYHVGCGGNSQRINRNQVCPNGWCNPNSVSGCFNVSAGSSCSVHSLGPPWTPWPQGYGTNAVSFSVSSFYRPLFEDGDPRCY